MESDGFTLVGSKKAENILLEKVLKEKVLEEKECGICFEVQTSDDLIATNCGHIFCRTCLQKWKDAKINLKCPMCREKLHWREPIRDWEQEQRERDREYERAQRELERSIARIHKINVLIRTGSTYIEAVAAIREQDRDSDSDSE